MSDVLVVDPDRVQSSDSPAEQAAGLQAGRAGQEAGGAGPAGDGPQGGSLPGSRRLGPRRCAELAGYIVLALLPLAVVAAFIAVLVFGQLGSGAAGGCGGG